MAQHIDNFRLKLKNTKKMKRSSLSFATNEAVELDAEITELEKKVKKLEAELLQQQTLSVDIVGREF
jgi:polyhydroxyalkanoate synthesis regulator phasin